MLAAIHMRPLIIILSFILFGCKAKTDIDNTEQREHGLSYIKGTNKLVEGEVIRKFENGNIAELQNFVKGKPIGDWFAYGYSGEVISYGFGVDAKKYQDKFKSTDLTNSVLSINIEGNYSTASLYLDNKEIFKDTKLLLDMVKEILGEYSDKYKINDIVVFDNEHEYNIAKSAIINSGYTLDTISNQNKMKVRIR